MNLKMRSPVTIPEKSDLRSTLSSTYMSFSFGKTLRQHPKIHTSHPPWSLLIRESLKKFSNMLLVEASEFVFEASLQNRGKERLPSLREFYIGEGRRREGGERSHVQSSDSLLSYTGWHLRRPGIEKWGCLYAVGVLDTVVVASARLYQSYGSVHKMTEFGIEIHKIIPDCAICDFLLSCSEIRLNKGSFKSGSQFFKDTANCGLGICVHNEAIFESLASPKSRHPQFMRPIF